MQNTNNVNIRWLDLTDKNVRAEMLVTATGSDTRSVKVAALNKLGINVQENEQPLTAYVRAMCSENNLPFSEPAPPQIGDAILQCGAGRFIFWLA